MIILHRVIHIVPNLVVYGNIITAKKVRFPDGAFLPKASGCHLNRFLFTLALGIYKEMSQSDGGGIPEEFLIHLKNPNFTTYEVLKLMQKNMIQKAFAHKIIKKHELNYRTSDFFIPWIVLENKKAFKKWI